MWYRSIRDRKLSPQQIVWQASHVVILPVSRLDPGQDALADRFFLYALHGFGEGLPLPGSLWMQRPDRESHVRSSSVDTSAMQAR